MDDTQRDPRLGRISAGAKGTVTRPETDSADDNGDNQDDGKEVTDG
jgi:hypothetical protein